ncbi:MAG: imidazole glycerol phosphate synthase subunit HisH [Bacillota bacterium]
MAQVVIVDSECANLSSIYKAVKKISLEPVVSGDPRLIAAAQAVIFPGVGSFAHASSLIHKKKLTWALLKVITEDRPFLGICLGMQLLFSKSEESSLSHTDEPARGLNVIKGEVKRFPAGLPVPHVGWNKVMPAYENFLFEGLSEGAYFYFTHSYYARPIKEEKILGLTEYGFSFTAAVKSGNLYGVQFHPEKSGPAGLRLLANFGNIIADRRYLKDSHTGEY